MFVVEVTPGSQARPTRGLGAGNVVRPSAGKVLAHVSFRTAAKEPQEERCHDIRREMASLGPARCSTHAVPSAYCCSGASTCAKGQLRSVSRPNRTELAPSSLVERPYQPCCPHYFHQRIIIKQKPQLTTVETPLPIRTRILVSKQSCRRTRRRSRNGRSSTVDGRGALARRALPPR